MTGPRPTVAVVGAGMMGAQIAVEFALHGYPVHVYSRDVARAADRIDDTVALVARLSIGTDADAARARSAIQMASSVDGLPDAELVVESVPEDMDLKVAVLSEVAAVMTSPTIASNTSSLSISELGDRIGRPAQTLGAHYWTPPLLMPLVEVAPGVATEPARVDGVRGILADIGKVTVVVRREVPGFIWNRLQFAILREALHLVDAGVASIDDIDAVTRLGLGRRWNQVGLFGSIALGGARTWEKVAATLFPQLSDAVDAAGLEQLVARFDDEWRAHQGRRRDEGLAQALLADRNRAQSESQAAQ